MRPFTRPTARELLAMGAKVVITGRDQDRLTQAAQEFGSVNLLTVQADVTPTEHWQRLVQATLARFGRIDVLVNDAGAGIHIAPLEEQSHADIAAAFQNVMAEVLAEKSMQALKQTGSRRLVVAGGVGANKQLRQRLFEATAKLGAQVYFPPLDLCTDNGAMVAFAGALRLQQAQAGAQPFSVKPRWDLQSLATI